MISSAKTFSPSLESVAAAISDLAVPSVSSLRLLPRLDYLTASISTARFCAWSLPGTAKAETRPEPEAPVLPTWRGGFGLPGSELRSTTTARRLSRSSNFSTVSSFGLRPTTRSTVPPSLRTARPSTRRTKHPLPRPAPEACHPVTSAPTPTASPQPPATRRTELCSPARRSTVLGCISSPATSTVCSMSRRAAR